MYERPYEIIEADTGKTLYEGDFYDALDAMISFMDEHLPDYEMDDFERCAAAHAEYTAMDMEEGHQIHYRKQVD